MYIVFLSNEYGLMIVLCIVELIEVGLFCMQFNLIRILLNHLLHMMTIAHNQAYLPGVGDTLIRKEVLPWRGLAIALSAGLTYAIFPNVKDSGA